MANEDLFIELNFGTNGSGAKDIEAMAKSSLELNDSEKKYQKLLKDRIEAYGIAKRLAADMKQLLGEQESAEQRLSRLVRSRIDAMKEEKKIKEEMARLGHGPAAGPGFLTGGGLGKIGGAVTGFAAAAGIYALTNSMQQLAKMTEVANSALSTQVEKNQAIAASVPVIGEFVGSLQQFREAVAGADRQMEIMTRAHISRMAYIGAEGGAFRSNLGAFNTASASSAAASAFDRGRGGAFAGSYSRYGGALNDPRAFGRFEAMSGVEGGMIHAQRGLLGAQSNLGGLGAFMPELRGRVAGSTAGAAGEEKRYEKFVGYENAPGGEKWTGAKFDALSKLQGHYAALRSNLSLLEEQENKLKDAAIARANAQGAVADAALNKDRQRLAVLKEEEGIQRAQYGAFGGMNTGQQRYALRLARQASERGLGSLRIPQLHALTGAGAGYEVQRELERRGGGSANAEFRQLMGMRGTLDQTLKDKIQLNQTLQVTIEANAEKVAREIAKIDKEYMEKVFVREAEKQRVNIRAAEVGALLQAGGRGQ